MATERRPAWARRLTYTERMVLGGANGAAQSGYRYVSWCYIAAHRRLRRLGLIDDDGLTARGEAALGVSPNAKPQDGG